MKRECRRTDARIPKAAKVTDPARKYLEMSTRLRREL